MEMAKASIAPASIRARRTTPAPGLVKKPERREETARPT
jgi:hypothetical protein